ncbi:MAG: nucleoside-diphosphate sugar epimerase/dehydratase [Cyclobacteriaceae bacterium]|nr:nucleoside-diphosphate sugar epimerase/dehydratase [Cyclobacteriaceae bacterium]
MLFHFIRNLRIIPRWVVLFLDLFIISFSCFIGFLLRFNFTLPQWELRGVWVGVFLYVVAGVLAMFITGSYRGIIRYTGLQDGGRIIFMVLLCSLIASTINIVSEFYFQLGYVIPFSVIVIGFLSSSLLLFNYRLVVKHLFSSYRNVVVKKSRVIIYGAGQTGVITRHVIDSSSRTRTVGFLENDESKIGKALDGVKIFDAKFDNLESRLNEIGVDELVITVKDLSLEQKNQLVDICIANRIKVRVIPPVEKWVKGELSVNQIKEVRIEDLLGRDAIHLDKKMIKMSLRGQKVLVTGAAGSIGSELVRQIIQCSPESLILVDQSESELYEIEWEIQASQSSTKTVLYLADITNKDRMTSIFEFHKPNIVYHAAAYKHVPMIESNPSEAVLCNILGTKILADLSVKFGVSKFIMVSTDKAVNPTNVMGCSKRIAEIYVQSYNAYLLNQQTPTTLFVTTRFGNVLGSSGSVIPVFKKQIQRGGPIMVTHPDVTRYFMTIQEACELVLEAGAMGKGGEIFIFDMGQAVKIVDLAKKMIYLSGLELGKDIDIAFIGLREGEKLYEELLNTSENTIPTHHSKIMIARVKEYQFTEISNYIDLFNDLVYDKNELKMVALMKELVPEYKSNYSRYEVLDKLT